MAELINTQRKGGVMSTFNKIPWTLLIIIYMVVIHTTETHMEGVPGYVFLGLCVAVMFAEFFKSGDINVGTFLVDVISSVGALVIATVLMSYLYFSMKQIPSFFDWFGSAIILGDAVLSPFNAFRTALRNLGLGNGM
jgi:hypothetical protein